ncbi:MAG: glycosyltransferase, partial [Mycobacterium sp.]
MTPGVTALVVAKAPVPGLAKTRLAAAVGDEAAADIAAAALLDTLDAVAGTPFAARVVALTG